VDHRLRLRLCGVPRSDESQAMRCVVLFGAAVSILSQQCSSLSFRYDELISSNFYKSEDPSLLEVFQVFPPPLSSEELDGSSSCSFTLMHHVFAESAGNPYVGMASLFGCT
jgi:hypothetical protein